MKNSIQSICTNLFILGFLFIQSGCVQHDQQHSQMEHGEINFEVSCNQEAQNLFTNGLGTLHHMMYEQAHDIFQNTIEADENCAMGYWGIAMTQFNPLWAPPNDEMFKKGQEAIQQAVDAGAETEKEQYHIRALKTYYETVSEQGYREGVSAWNSELEQIHQNHPDDIDAGAFYGLSLLATASPDDETFNRQETAGALMEDLFEQSPEHPGLFHYIIHAYDNPVLAEKGVDFAHGYDKLAPDVPHALHMPSHIFVRIGNWPETIDWNRRSADAALNQPVGNMTSFHHAHALDYLMYGYLQKGLDKQAKDVLDEMLTIDNYQPHFGAAYGIAAAHSRYVLERRDWEKAANLDLGVHSTYPWENFPQYEAITWWTRGLGSAKTGDIEKAQNAVNTLEELHEKTLEMGEDYWALLVDVQRITVDAWIAQAEENFDLALQMMRDAAELEDSVDKHPVTPSEVLPARELLGDMLMLHEKPEEAIAAYQKTLEISPNRFNSLFGAAKAAELMGDNDLAESYFTRLNEITVHEESDRPELEQAKLHKTQM